MISITDNVLSFTNNSYSYLMAYLLLLQQHIQNLVGGFLICYYPMKTSKVAVENWNLVNFSYSHTILISFKISELTLKLLFSNIELLIWVNSDNSK